MNIYRFNGGFPADSDGEESDHDGHGMPKKRKVDWFDVSVIICLFTSIAFENLHRPDPVLRNETKRWDILASNLTEHENAFRKFAHFKGAALKKAFLDIIARFKTERQNLSGKASHGDTVKCRELVEKMGQERELFFSIKQSNKEEQVRKDAAKDNTMLGFEMEQVGDVRGEVNGHGQQAGDYGTRTSTVTGRTTR
jgi:hypothetical protein